MYDSIKNNKILTMSKVNTFVDGAAIKTPGVNSFNILRQCLNKIFLVAEGHVSSSIIQLYNEDGKFGNQRDHRRACWSTFRFGT